MVSAENAVQRYLDGTGSGNAAKKYADGIEAVTESPMAKAASGVATQKYLESIRKSVESGYRQNRLNAVPLSRWKDGAKGKGKERYASGCRASADKVRAHFQKWAPIYQQISAECAAMPNNSTEDALAKVRRAIEISKQAAGKI